MPMSLSDHQLYYHLWVSNTKGKLLRLEAAFRDKTEAYNLMRHYNENTEKPKNIRYIVFCPNPPEEEGGAK